MGSILQRDDESMDQSEELLLSYRSGEDIHEQYCKIHDKKKDIICVEDKIKICSHCALFGEHKTHHFLSESDLLIETTTKVNQLNKFIACSFFQDKFANKWKELEKQCQSKSKNLIVETNCHFESIINKLSKVRESMIKKIQTQFSQIEKHIREEKNKCHNNPLQILLANWAKTGLEKLNSLEQNMRTEKFSEQFRKFSNFDWKYGEKTLRQLETSSLATLEKYKVFVNVAKLDVNEQVFNSFFKKIKKYICFTFSIHYAKSIQKSSEESIESNEFMEINQPFSTINDVNFLEQIGPVLRPSCSSIALETVNTINSPLKKCSHPSKGRISGMHRLGEMKENTPTASAFPSMKNFKSPKQSHQQLRSRMRSARSPTYKSQIDPLKVVTEYEKESSPKCLNLSHCQLQDDALHYFLLRALKHSIPKELILTGNQMSMSTFIRVLPLLLKCEVLNLIGTGIGLDCFETLWKHKTEKKLSEVYLSSKTVKVTASQNKIEKLNKLGIKIVIV